MQKFFFWWEATGQLPLLLKHININMSREGFCSMETSLDKSLTRQKVVLELQHRSGDVKISKNLNKNSKQILKTTKMCVEIFKSLHKIYVPFKSSY